MQFTEGHEHSPTPASVPNQLIPNVVDGLAQVRPQGAYALIPRSFTSYDAGYRTVTWRDLANAVNGAAWFLSEQLGKGVLSHTLAYIGPNDIGYVVYALGAVKAGHALLSLSARNTKYDHASLFQATGCTTLLTLPPPYSLTVQTVLAGVDPNPRIIHVPTLFELLDNKYEHFPYPKTFAASKDEPLVMVHTSGTTNTPKLVTYTHSLAAAYHNWTQGPAPAGYENMHGVLRSFRAFTTFPFFHAGGLIIALLEHITNAYTIVTPLAGVAPSAQGVVEALKHVEGVGCLYLAAPFAEQISKNAEMLQAVTKTATVIAYGGGDVSEGCASAFISRGVTFAGFNGSTETTSYPIIRPLEGWDVLDLKYIQPHPVANIVFQQTQIPSLFEAVLIKNTDGNQIQPVFTMFPDLNEYRTKDLFSPHPSKPNLWLYKCRADDMIVSATGEMCNPVSYEQQISQEPDVAAAIMIGTKRYQKALIVEPTDDNLSRQDLLDKIWPAIELANQRYPQVNHVDQNHVLFTKPGVPLLRAGKGTVQRAPSIAFLRDQIEQLYTSAGDGGVGIVEPYKVHITSA